jgi:coenzyme PQQ precursor peptide PqqA
MSGFPVFAEGGEPFLVLSYPVFGSSGRPSMLYYKKQEFSMSWKSPKIVEIALGAEINSYACAEARK